MQANIVVCYTVIYTPLKIETISELLELKRKDLQYLKAQFNETYRTYTSDEIIKKDYQYYLTLESEIDKLKTFLEQPEMEKMLSNLESLKTIYENEQIDDQEIIETNMANIDAEIADLNSKLGKYPTLDEDVKISFLNNINKLKTLKREKVEYFYIHNKDIKVAYNEIFQNKNNTPEETGISKLTVPTISKSGKSENRTIGYRYYRNGINNGFENKDFITIIEGDDRQYHPIQGTGNYEEDLEIIHSIFRENYRGGMGYEVSGNREKTSGITAIAKHYNQNINVFSLGRQLGNIYYLTEKEKKKSIVIDNITGEKSIHTPTCFNTNSGYTLYGSREEISKFTLILDKLDKEETTETNKPNLFHLSFADHATSYLLDNKHKSY